MDLQCGDSGERPTAGGPVPTGNARRAGFGPAASGGDRRSALRKVWLGAAFAGSLVMAIVITLTIEAGLIPNVHPPAWLGAQLHRTSAHHRGVWAIGVVLAVGVLVALWSRLQSRAGGDGVGLRLTAAVAALWAAPLALGPPLLSGDVYSYAAVGELAEAGRDPYAFGPAALGRGPFLAAVDPLWRHTPTPYGPLLVALTHGTAEVAGDSVARAVVLLRLLAVIAAAGAVVVAVRAAAPAVRPQVFLLTALNPLVLLHLVSGAHLDALIGAAAVGVVWLTVAGRWHVATVLAVAAGMVKAPALLLVAFVLLYAVRRARRGTAGLLATAAATVGAMWLGLPNAFGWIHGLGVPGRALNSRVPSFWLAEAVAGMSRLTSHELAWRTALTVARGLTMVAGAAVALLIIWRATARADRASALRGVGWALIVLALSGPVIYGWYMAWGLFAAAAGSRPQDRTVLVVLSAWVCTIGLPPMQGVPAVLRVITWAGVVLLWWWARPAPMRAPRLLEREGAGAV